MNEAPQAQRSTPEFPGRVQTVSIAILQAFEVDGGNHKADGPESRAESVSDCQGHQFRTPVVDAGAMDLDREWSHEWEYASDSQATV